MYSDYDEITKSLAASVSRRESLRHVGALLAGAALAPLGLRSAWAGKAKTDPCKSFCNRCSNKSQQNQCLAACHACNRNTSRLGGSCGNYVCCPTASCRGSCSDLKSDPNCGSCGNDCRTIGMTCCGTYCADLANDFANCGGCGNRCEAPGPYESGACIGGACVYDCVPGTADCGDGTCTDLGSDPNNCGACGFVCAASTPFCTNGTCADAYCFGANLDWDSRNCGFCGNVCPPQTACAFGVCEGLSIN